MLKTDNRPTPVRTADTANINIGTFGGHYIHTIETRAGQLDALAWVALQTGSWGNLNQGAGAFAAEAGWQPRFLARLKPWFRGGYDYGSGDKNAGDSTHGTFFQVLPTPRVYARFPFFNMMNNRDVFGELQLRPQKRSLSAPTSTRFAWPTATISGTPAGEPSSLGRSVIPDALQRAVGIGDSL